MVAGAEAKHGHRWGRTLLICAIVLVVLLVLADRLGVIYAEHRIADQAQAELAAENIQSTGTPSVTIDGFPFLTQVVSGHYGEIDIDVPQPTSLGVRLDSLHIVATDVDAPVGSVVNHSGSITAKKVTGTAEIDWASFQNMVDLSGLKQFGVDTSSIKVTSASGGQIHLAAPLSVNGQDYTVGATGTISVRDDVLHVALSDISTGGALPAVIATEMAQFQSALTFDTRIPALPYHLTIDRVSADGGGVVIAASATNVTIG